MNMYGKMKKVSKDLRCLNIVLTPKKKFRNIVVYRVKNKSKIIAQIIKILYPTKSDLEICLWGIGARLAVFHGYNKVILCENAGENLSVYQGVTIGKNPKDNLKELFLKWKNASVGADAVVMKDIPDDSVVIGNPCVVKKKHHSTT